MTRIRYLTIAFVFAAGCANASGGAPDGPGSAVGSDGAVNPALGGHAGHGFVAGGIVAKSAHYKLVGTLSTGAGTSASAHYTQHGGVLGATQK